MRKERRTFNDLLPAEMAYFTSFVENSVIFFSVRIIVQRAVWINQRCSYHVASVHGMTFDDAFVVYCKNNNNTFITFISKLA